MSIKASAVRSQWSQNATTTHTSVIENSTVKKTSNLGLTSSSSRHSETLASAATSGKQEPHSNYFVGSEPVPSLNNHVSKKRPCDQWTSVGICIKGDRCQYLHDPQVRIAAIELFIISTHESRSKKLYVSVMKN